MLQPQPPAEDGAEPPEPGEPSEAKTLTEAELVGAIGSKWGPILDGVATCTQQCIATVPRAAPAPTPRRHRCRPRRPRCHQRHGRCRQRHPRAAASSRPPSRRSLCRLPPRPHPAWPRARIAGDADGSCAQARAQGQEAETAIHARAGCDLHDSAVRSKSECARARTCVTGDVQYLRGDLSLFYPLLYRRKRALSLWGSRAPVSRWQMHKPQNRPRRARTEHQHPDSPGATCALCTGGP